jgi:endonuclease YncB( thermonuclease family)
VKIASRSCLLLLIASTATAEPILSGAIQVIDGDTISTQGRTIRLVGFDTPEPENLSAL